MRLGQSEMSWKLTIVLPDAKLGPAMNALREHGVKSITSEYVADKAAPASVVNVSKVVNGKSKIISLGPKESKIGSNVAKVVAKLEQLEKAQGPHTVTRQELNETLRKAHFPEWVIATGITNWITAGYLRQD